MATGKLAKGFTLEVETAAGSGVFQKLFGLTGFSKPNAKIDEVETTDMDDAAKRFIAGLADYGSMDFPINWEPNSATDVFIEAWKADALTGDGNRATRLTYRGGATDTIDTFVSSYDAKADSPGAVMKGTLSLRCSGAPTRAP